MSVFLFHLSSVCCRERRFYLKTPPSSFFLFHSAIACSFLASACSERHRAKMHIPKSVLPLSLPWGRLQSTPRSLTIASLRGTNKQTNKQLLSLILCSLVWKCESLCCTLHLFMVAPVSVIVHAASVFAYVCLYAFSIQWCSCLAWQFTFAVLSVCSHIEQMLISLSVYSQNAVTIMIMHKVFTC